MSYKDLKSYQNTVIISDFTVEFVKLYIDPKSRTRDQMEQAARSGKQNIAEGSAQKNLEGEIYLLKIAYGSLKELAEDYEDFLRQKGLEQWTKDSPEAKAVRDLAYKSHKSYETYKSYMNSPEDAANSMICLINQTTYLIDQQLKALEKQFIEKGGQKEELRWKREEYKKKQMINRFWRKHQ
jgi:restriction system protein